MGGIGSGRHHRERRYTTDEVVAIDIRDVFRLPLHLDTWHAAPHNQKHHFPLYVRVRHDVITFGVRTNGDIEEIGNRLLHGRPAISVAASHTTSARITIAADV